MPSEEIERIIRYLFLPYGKGEICPSYDSFLIKDLSITGSDYFDIVEDIEHFFEVDMTDFLVGPNPGYVSGGISGFIAGFRKIPTFRDVRIIEIIDFITKFSEKEE